MMETGSALAIDKATQQIVHVNDVPRGNSCNCCCIHCGRDLQARKGEERSHHFKHITGIECNPETILHSLAKRILSQNDHIRLPEKKGVFRYDSVATEVWLDNQRPDIVLSAPSGLLHVEIAVTSFITVAKKEKIIAKQYRTVEIDLGRISRDTGYSDLTKMVIEETSNKEIIYWPSVPVEMKAENENNGGFWLLLLLAIAGIFGLRNYLKNKKGK